MTIKEARKIVQEFADNTKRVSDEEFFMFAEAMDFLINEEHRPQDMMYLGGVYYEMKRFDLALKYYEMAATYDYDEAYECLGYIWYYGRTGERDYKKAFENFSKMMEKGHLVATYKVADMYKNGYYVEKDMATYIMKWLIDDLYELMEFDEEFFDFYDLYYLLKTPHKITFDYEEEAYSIESVMEGDECVVNFNGKWFHSRDDFFKDAFIGDNKLTTIYDDLYGFEVIE